MSKPISAFFRWGDIYSMRCSSIQLISLVLDGFAHLTHRQSEYFQVLGRQRKQSHYPVTPSDGNHIAWKHRFSPWSQAVSRIVS